MYNVIERLFGRSELLGKFSTEQEALKFIQARRLANTAEGLEKGDVILSLMFTSGDRGRYMAFEGVLVDEQE